MPPRLPIEPNCVASGVRSNRCRLPAVDVQADTPPTAAPQLLGTRGASIRVMTWDEVQQCLDLLRFACVNKHLAEACKRNQPLRAVQKVPVFGGVFDSQVFDCKRKGAVFFECFSFAGTRRGQRSVMVRKVHKAARGVEQAHICARARGSDAASGLR